MANPFVAEIRIFAGNFAPIGWATCDGQLMPISQNTALFSLLGTTYGGDGRSTFALPNLEGSAPMQAGQGPGLSLRDLGETGGEQTVTLLQTEMPAHSHTFTCVTDRGNTTTSTNSYPGTGAAGPPNQAIKGFLYSSNPANAQMNPFSLSIAGGNLPHNNMVPYLGLTFIIALQGVFPARS
jgi:microcystin-dependent protein